MTRFVRLTMLGAMAAGLVACGGAKLGGGKQGAAQAAFQASQPAGRGNQTAQNLLKEALASGATTITVSANCAKGGTASLALDTSAGSGVGTVNYTVTYDGCNEDGKNKYDGSMATSIGVSGTATSASIYFAMKGKLTISGDISDYIDANVKLTMDFAATSMHSGSVKLVLDGTIKTTDGNYTYANETVDITAGELPQG